MRSINEALILPSFASFFEYKFINHCGDDNIKLLDEILGVANNVVSFSSCIERKIVGFRSGKSLSMPHTKFTVDDKFNGGKYWMVIFIRIPTFQITLKDIYLIFHLQGNCDCYSFVL